MLCHNWNFEITLPDFSCKCTIVKSYPTVLPQTKHASWFLTSVLGKVIPNLDNLETVEEYLETLGRRHAKAGVRIEHLDLLALVYCSAVRAVVANQGM